MVPKSSWRQRVLHPKGGGHLDGRRDALGVSGSLEPRASTRCPCCQGAGLFGPTGGWWGEGVSQASPVLRNPCCGGCSGPTGLRGAEGRRLEALPVLPLHLPPAANQSALWGSRKTERRTGMVPILPASPACLEFSVFRM